LTQICQYGKVISLLFQSLITARFQIKKKAYSTLWIKENSEENELRLTILLRISTGKGMISEK